MDDRRFDDLTRALVARPSRRAVFQVLASGLAGGALALGSGRRATAQDPTGCSLPCQTPDLTRCPTEPNGFCDCIYLDRDNDNCGACGHRCPIGHSCLGGSCLCYRGSGIWEEPCNGSCLIDFDSDPANCGSCGHACGLGEVCVGGNCYCGGSRCGSCETCDGGTCVRITCPICQICSNGRCVADANRDNLSCGDELMCCGGACVSNRPTENCGSCGNNCMTNQPGNTYAACVDGQCVYTCFGNFVDCVGDPATSCETNTDTDAAHCGGCDVPCGDGQV